MPDEPINPADEPVNQDSNEHGREPTPNPPQPTPQPKKRELSRIVVVENVYHQGNGGFPPIQVTPRYTQFLKTDEQPYQRQTRVTEEWVQLDTGWIKDACSMVLLENMEGVFQYRNPTKEEVAEVAKRVIDVAFVKDAVEIVKDSVKVETDPQTGKNLGRTMHSPPRPEAPSVTIEPDMQIPPLQSIRIIPISPRKVWVRCREGVARIMISVFPE